MSRCFPFPPPGYEKKARIEDVDLPKKDKHKKKRKKEKRDQKEKRKSRNGDKKEKEKDRFKDKTRTLDQAKLPDKIHCHNRQFLVQRDHKDKDNCRLTEKKYAGQSAGYGEGEFNYSSHLPEKSRASEIEPQLGWRIKDGGGGSRNLLGEKLSVYLPQRDDGVGRIVAEVTQNVDEGKTKGENKEIGEEKCGNREIQELSKFNKRETIQPMVKDGVDSMENNADTRVEGKRWKGNGRDEKSKEKQKDKEKQEGKDKDIERDKNKKRKEKIEQKIGNLEKSKESNEGDITSTDSNITSQLLRESHKPVARMGSLMKRKDFEIDEILHAKDHMSSNSAKFTSSSDLLRENHKMLKSCQSSVAAVSNWQVTANTNSFELDGKEDELNGIIEIPPALSSPKSNKLIKFSKVPSKPPHPDLEYLSQVYLVPKMEELTDFCDQDWLYCSNASKLKNLKPHSFEMEMTTPHVWAEAIQIDSINICALPYVIPY